MHSSFFDMLLFCKYQASLSKALPQHVLSGPKDEDRLLFLHLHESPGHFASSVAGSAPKVSQTPLLPLLAAYLRLDLARVNSKCQKSAAAPRQLARTRDRKPEGIGASDLYIVRECCFRHVAVHHQKQGQKERSENVER